MKSRGAIDREPDGGHVSSTSLVASLAAHPVICMPLLHKSGPFILVRDESLPRKVSAGASWPQDQLMAYYSH